MSKPTPPIVNGDRDPRGPAEGTVDLDRGAERFVDALPLPALLQQDGRVVHANRAWVALAGENAAQPGAPAPVPTDGDLPAPTGALQTADVDVASARSAGPSLAPPSPVHRVTVRRAGRPAELVLARQPASPPPSGEALFDLHESLVQAEVNRMIVHEVRNLLSVMDAALAGPSVPMRNGAAANLADLRRLHGSLGELVERATLARNANPAPEARPVDMDVFLPSAVRFLRRLVARHAMLVAEIERVGAVLGDEGQILRILLNLGANAAHAIAEADADQGTIRLGVRQDGDRVIIEITDDGPGIAPEVLRRIFEPGFTTRWANGGTGVGLSTSRDLAERMGGALEVESTLGAGTTARLTLPASPARADRDVTARRAAADDRGAVLVVDPDPRRRRMAGAVLSRRFSATAVADADGAAEALQRGLPAVAILCAMDESAATLDRLRAWVQRSRPDLEHRLFAITGASATEAQTAFLRRSGLATLRWPTRIERLADRVDTAIADAVARAPDAAPARAERERRNDARRPGRDLRARFLLEDGPADFALVDCSASGIRVTGDGLERVPRSDPLAVVLRSPVRGSEVAATAHFVREHAREDARADLCFRVFGADASAREALASW